MKLHLPCALRSALLACFAIACTAPTWAATDIVIDGSVNDFYISSEGGNEYTLTPGSDLISQGVSIGSVNLMNSVTLNIGSADNNFSAIQLENVLVADKKNLTINIAANTIVYLNNVNFTGEVNYVLGEDSILVISASDCTKGSISGSGKVYFTGGILDATKASSPFFTDIEYVGSCDFSDITDWSAIYAASGSDILFDLAPDAIIHVNAPGGNGGTVAYSESGYHGITWIGSGGHEKIVSDSPSVIVDPSGVYRDSAEDGSKYWYLQKDVSVENLQSGTMGDKTDKVLASLAASDSLLFAGGSLTSSSNVTVRSAIEVEGDNKVHIAPKAGTTITFTNGDGALSNGNGLVLSGGAGSTVVLKGVKETDTVNGAASPTGITFATNNTTLSISGPRVLVMDGNENSFQSGTGLSKGDGGTLRYLAKTVDKEGNTVDKDTIGALANTSGTVDIGRAATLDVGTITAGTLSVAKEGTKLTVGSANVGDLSIGNAYNTGVLKVTADKLTSSGTITLGAYATLTAGTMNATNAKVSEGATLTGDSLKAGGTVTIDGSGWTSGKVTIGDITVNAQKNLTATMTGMNFSAGSLTTKSVSNALITVTGATTKAAGSTLNLGTVTNTIINAVEGTTIKGAVFDTADKAGNNTVLGTGKLTLSGTTHGTGTTVASTGDVKLSGAELLGGASVIAHATIEADNTVSGGAHYAISESVATIKNVTGLATAASLQLTSARIDISGVKEETDTPTTLFEGNVMIDPDNVSYRTASGLRGQTVLDENGNLAFTVRDAVAEIMAGLRTGIGSPNADALSRTLLNAVEASGGRGATGTSGTLKEILNYLCNESDASLANRSKALEALSSGSLTMLADSQRRGVTNTINTLRNRVAQMGNPQDIEYETNVHAWIEADGAYNDIDQDGPLAGYEYNAWGGTVGVHADAGNFSFGAAISASYGDLTSKGADNAEGSHDTQSLSLFARHQHGSWTQMGLLSIGRNELDMTRHINAPVSEGESKVYTGEGDTDGYTITAYYEAGYTIVLDEDCTQLLQPHASIMLTSAHMGNFSESGSIAQAGLESAAADYFYGTVGLGTRYQIVLGTNVEGRVCFAEARAKVVADFGDDTHEAAVRFVGAPNQSFIVSGAEVGRIGLQIGAGISVPVGVYTTLFADVDADFRDCATSMGGSAGIRVRF